MEVMRMMMVKMDKIARIKNKIKEDVIVVGRVALDFCADVGHLHGDFFG